MRYANRLSTWVSVAVLGTLGACGGVADPGGDDWPGSVLPDGDSPDHPIGTIPVEGGRSPGRPVPEGGTTTPVPETGPTNPVPETGPTNPVPETGPTNPGNIPATIKGDPGCPTDLGGFREGCSNMGAVCDVAYGDACTGVRVRYMCVGGGYDAGYGYWVASSQPDLQCACPKSPPRVGSRCDSASYLYCRYEGEPCSYGPTQDEYYCADWGGRSVWQVSLGWCYEGPDGGGYPDADWGYPDAMYEDAGVIIEYDAGRARPQ